MVVSGSGMVSHVIISACVSTGPHTVVSLVSMTPSLLYASCAKRSEAKAYSQKTRVLKSKQCWCKECDYFLLM